MSEVSEDSDLCPEEKQLSLTVTKAEDEFTVYTDVATVTRWLLSHEHSTILETHEKDGEVTGVRARLPIACVKLQADTRKSSNFSQLVAALDTDGENE